MAPSNRRSNIRQEAGHGIAVGVFNPNGIADLVTADQTDNTVTVIPGVGRRDIWPATIVSGGQRPSFVVAADFNGDLGPDTAVTNFGASGPETRVSIFLGGTISTGQLNDIPVYGVGQQNVQSNFAPNGSFYATCFQQRYRARRRTDSDDNHPHEQQPESVFVSPTHGVSTPRLPYLLRVFVFPTGTATYSYDHTSITGCIGLLLCRMAVCCLATPRRYR